MSATRRQILAASAMAAASGPALGARRRRIESAIATICLDGFGDEDFAHAFAGIPKLGMKNVEFNCWHPRTLTPRGIASIKDRCGRRGLRPISIQASGFVGGDVPEVTREIGRVLWLIEACKRLGCRIVKCTGSARGSRGGLDAILAVLKEIAPAAEEAGVVVTLENHFRNNLEFPEDYDRVFGAIDSPAIGMCLDPAHFNASNVDLVALVDRFAPRILHVDVKDNAGPGAHRAVPFGTGAVKLAEMIEQLIARGYAGYLVVELARKDRSVTLAELAAGYTLTKKYER